MMNIYMKKIIVHGNINIMHWCPPSLNIYPPPVDEYKCRNRGVRAEVGKKRDYASSVIQVTWPVYGADQDKNGKPKPDKPKPDKTKRENDKGLKKTKPPKRDGLASIL